LKLARILIEQFCYWRRKEELEDAEESAKRGTQFSLKTAV